MIHESRRRAPAANSPWIRRLVWLGPILFFALAAVIGFRKPGLQYDEALFEHGTVQMLVSGGEPPFAHDHGSWIRLGSRFWPLMVIPYIGAAPQYLLLPVFAAAGPDPAAARVLGSVLGALGLLGIGRAVSSAIGPGVAAAAVLVLAVHPGLLLTVLYDNNAFAAWMACAGLLALGIERYARRRDGVSAFWVGAAAGAGVWCRANFLWLVAALAVSVLVVFGRSAFGPRRVLALFAAGGLLGSLPLVVYEVASRFATIRFLRQGGLSRIASVPYRIHMFFGSIFCDGYRESIWGAPGVPHWQMGFVGAVILASTIVVVRGGDGARSVEIRVGRAAVVTVAGYLAFAFESRLGIAAHHLVPLVPVEAIIVALAFRRIRTWPGARPLAFGIAGLYSALAASVIFAAARGIRSTGGVGAWSDAIEKVAEVLQKKYPRRDVYLLDWGFENNLFVLSRGSISSREMLFAASRGTKAGGPGVAAIEPDPDAVYVIRRWEPEDPPGSPLGGFEARMTRADIAFERTRVLQRDGDPYADIYGVPGREPAPVRITAIDPSRILARRAFHVQPTGNSALAVTGTGFRPTDIICWNGRPLSTTFGSPLLMSAEVPPDLFEEPGTVRITIRHGVAIEPGAEATLSILTGGR